MMRKLGWDKDNGSYTFKSDFSERMATANAISDQIWKEQQLRSLRLTWNLSFQTFLAAIFVYAGSSLAGSEKFAVQAILSISAILVTIASYKSISAAQDQSKRLKRHWVQEFNRRISEDYEDSDVVSGPFPQPFSPKKISKLGRGAPQQICFILGCMWVGMLGLTAYSWVRSEISPIASLRIVKEPFRSIETPSAVCFITADEKRPPLLLYCDQKSTPKKQGEKKVEQTTKKR